ncbi:MAG: sulfatase-like hydrolase/transferase [bacterium]|nr:sulfatase-like hydrolase/transferase [bacterium]
MKSPRISGRRRSLSLLLAACCLVTAAAGCGPTERERLNLVIVTIDTCRADHLGAYGYREIDTPNIDALAAGGVLFTSAFTPIPITLPSHASIMTGTYPQYHGVRDNDMFVDDASQTLAEVLGAQGYRTAAFVSAYPLHHQFNLGQGFEVYDDDFESDDWRFLHRPFHEQFFFDERTADGTTVAATRWLDEGSEEPLFLWVHYFDPHANYQPPAPFDQLYAGRPYDGEIAAVDRALGRLVDHLRRIGEWESTVFILTADHGESLNDHQETTHALLLYDSTLHVPLIVRAPGLAPARVERMVRTLDIFPTALELLGLETIPTAEVQGISLRPLLAGGDALPELELYHETFYSYFKYGWSLLRAYRNDRYKIIEAPQPEIYQWREDRGELRDRAGEDGERVEAMRAELYRLLRRTENQRPPGESPTLDPEVQARLESLGYLGTTTRGHGEDLDRLLPEGVSVMAMMPVWKRYNLVKTALRMQQPELDLAFEEVRHILADDRGSGYQARYLLALILLSQERFDEARNTLETLYREHGAVDYRTLLELGALRLKMAEPAAAREVFLEAVTLRPEEPLLFFYLGWTAERLGDLETAVQDYEQALALDPDHSQALTNLGNLHSDQGRSAAAEEYLRRAAASTPYRAEVHYNLGVIAFRRGENRRSRGFFERALKIESGYDLARLGLARSLLELGEHEPALAQLRILLAFGHDEEVVALARSLLEGEGATREGVTPSAARAAGQATRR